MALIFGVITNFEGVHEVNLNKDVGDKSAGVEDNVRFRVNFHNQWLTCLTAPDGNAGAVREFKSLKFDHEDAHVSNNAHKNPEFLNEALFLLVRKSLYHEFRITVFSLEGYHPAQEEPLIRLGSKGHQNRQSFKEVEYEVQPRIHQTIESTLLVACKEHPVLKDDATEVADHVVVRKQCQFILGYLPLESGPYEDDHGQNYEGNSHAEVDSMHHLRHKVSILRLEH